MTGYRRFIVRSLLALLSALPGGVAEGPVGEELSREEAEQEAEGDSTWQSVQSLHASQSASAGNLPPAWGENRPDLVLAASGTQRPFPLVFDRVWHVGTNDGNGATIGVCLADRDVGLLVI